MYDGRKFTNQSIQKWEFKTTAPTKFKPNKDSRTERHYNITTAQSKPEEEDEEGRDEEGET